MRLLARIPIFFAALLLVCPVISADSNRVEIRGGILTPDGAAGIGYRVVFVSPESGRELTSEPADFDGEFFVLVPANEDYLASYVLAPGTDTRHPIENSPRIVIRDRGVVVNVQLVNGTANASLTGVGDSGGTLASGQKPRWKRPGAIVGYVIGAAAVPALLLGAEGGGADSSSPSMP